MMFLVIFGSLAAAMAVVAQGNLRTADSSLKVSRAMSAAEAGLVFASNRMQNEASRFVVEEGVIDADFAKIQFSTEGAVSTTKFTAMEGIAGTDTEVVLNTTDAVAINRTYNLEIRYSSTGFARFYVDGVKKHTSLSAHTAAAALHPVFGCQGLAVAETNFNIRQVRMSRVWQDG